MKGYKVFHSDWTCKDFKYEVGKIFEINEKPIICERGFHFCKKLSRCFNYYDFNPNNKVAEIEALGEIVEKNDKSCTNKIKIVKELSWGEVLNLVNTGYSNSGKDNTGSYNTGDYNVGNYNTGDYNVGYYNSGRCNSGHHNSGYNNSGHRNSGDHNSGNYNSGDWNSGDSNFGQHNSGYRNFGDFNSGDYNPGKFNSGNHNSGSRNSGNHNSGYYNSGDYNFGNYNSGNYNSGDYNSGDWNKTFFSSGVFNNLEEENIRMFNKPSEWTYKFWNNSQAKCILENIPMIKSNKEKQDKARQEWWNVLPDIEKEIILNLPNFDKKVFEDITGIKVNLNN